VYGLLAKSQQHFTKTKHKPKLTNTLSLFRGERLKYVDGLAMTGTERFRGIQTCMMMTRLLLCVLRREVRRHFINILISLFSCIGTYLNSNINKNTKTVREFKK
jgi:hypothetical protein